MSRYIDGDRLQDRIIASPLFHNFGQDGYFIKEFVLDLISRQPTADVVEVRHGEWVFGKLGGRDAWVCTLCGAGFTGENAEWIAKEHDFCPKCGAKMDGDRSENGTN